jgi:hypothetical protein
VTDNPTWQEVVDHYVQEHGAKPVGLVQDWWFVSVCDLDLPPGSQHVGCAVVLADRADSAVAAAMGLCPAMAGSLEAVPMPAGQPEVDLGPGWHDHSGLVGYVAR